MEPTLPLLMRYVLGFRKPRRDRCQMSQSWLTPEQDEADRLRIQHGVFQRLFDGRLIFPPIQSPRRILECGFGNASWAIDVADHYPNCEVRNSTLPSTKDPTWFPLLKKTA